MEVMGMAIGAAAAEFTLCMKRRTTPMRLAINDQ